MLLKEIWFYLTYEELKPVSVVLPSPARSWFYLTYEELKHTTLSILFNKPSGFYLTYEELKPTYLVQIDIFSTGILSYLWGIETYLQQKVKCLSIWFYLTYEELKRNIFIWRWTHGNRFYLTYEELKHRKEIWVPYNEDKDFILPMRNWNYTWTDGWKKC